MSEELRVPCGDLVRRVLEGRRGGKRREGKGEGGLCTLRVKSEWVFDSFNFDNLLKITDR